MKKRFSLCVALLMAAQVQAADQIHFWDQPQHGGNSFNRLPPDEAYFQSLRGYGATWVRLSWDKWKPEGRDFLIGDADNYQHLSPQDLATLKQVLARADKAGLKVVIAPLSLPWMRWSQNNGGKFDDRLWQDKKRWDSAIRFWRDLAQALKDKPAIAAYNLINEPAPEKTTGLSEQATVAALSDWYQQQQGTARNLPQFYNEVIAAIREVDKVTPVMVDGGWYGSARGFSGWPERLKDDRVLYSFHMYEPYAFTSTPNVRRKTPYVYPGNVPFGGELVNWDAGTVAKWMAAPYDWAERHQVPQNRVVAGEFGCIRTLKGCTQWLEDVLQVLDERQSHWAFYSFREDAWDGMDYELGSGKVPWKYWQAMEQNLPDPVPRKATAEFAPIQKRLAPTAP
ncbi:cellulase (glycosyl hydrolase family 5) [Yokenella regensburgei]|uniref:Cellulase (Glycosyl hydrolase family 5) n=1 Tax=Yokenella regensburgei TaxID=158877 RepID=A0ABX9S228_9ENTR|nr:cellulase family glycosylhydrolase [Yokenella regensburgei]RKR64531.1 cellulase (glycosyl hydrolase family 5) [Yokenella regensburgei]VFS17805.1 Endo-beta-mannanase [Yokenella regensburgei]